MSPAALWNNQTVAVFQADLTAMTLQDLRREIASMGGPERRLAFRGYYVLERDREGASLALMTGLITCAGKSAMERLKTGQGSRRRSPENSCGGPSTTCPMCRRVVAGLSGWP
jgi:hypothetical protein